MADLGELLGTLMVGIIKARRMADEQTAVLAEYYRTNPLLEGLSVPRIRIPELTIDLPFLIEEQTEGNAGQMEDPAKISDGVQTQLKATLAKNNIQLEPEVLQHFGSEVENQLKFAKQGDVPIMKETIARGVQNAFANSLAKTQSKLTSSEKEIIARELRAHVAATGVAREPTPPGLAANAKTAQVKDQASKESVARLRITLKEEGLEWAVQTNEAGGVTRTLQPE